MATQRTPSRQQTADTVTPDYLDNDGYPCVVDQSEIPAAQCRALVALYTSTTSAGWVDTTNWLTSPTPSDWFGVTVTAGNVTTLDLLGNDLVGAIPTEIGDLSGLTRLTLGGPGGSDLTGSIPSTIGALSALTELELTFGSLTGVIPSSLTTIAGLETINLARNTLTGPIPSGFGSLAALTEFDVALNNIAGAMPPDLGSATTLEVLSLFENDFAPGLIPPTYAALLNLRILELGDTQRTGTIPTWIGGFPSLTRLGLGENLLTGSIPTEIGDLSLLDFLAVHNNALTGPIPDEIATMGSLQYMYLYGNNLSGPIPASISGLTNLFDFRANDMQLTGQIPSGLGALTALTTVHLGGNRLTGIVPADLDDGVITSLQLAGNGCLVAGGDPLLAGWLVGLDVLWQDGCGDADLDGIFDDFEDDNNDGDTDPTTSPGPDTDSNGTPDYLDADDDGDGVLTSSEDPDPNGDGHPSDAIDTDLDTVVDYLDADSFTCTALAGIPISECNALVAIFNSTGGPAWLDNTSWLSGSAAGWFGVTVAGGQVTGLDLQSNNLVNYVPSELADLTALSVIRLNGNELEGRIQSSIATLTPAVLSLADNQCLSTDASTTTYLDGHDANWRNGCLRTIAGTVFEDIDYGGGAGRTLVAAAGNGRPGVVVEFYDRNGRYFDDTATNGSGDYITLAGAATYTVRVVNSSVTSSRLGGGSSETAIQTFRIDSFGEPPLTGSSEVGGRTPHLLDAGPNLAAIDLAALETASETVQSQVTLDLAPAGAGNVDYGFNFSTLVNTRDNGPGSLRHVIRNANQLGDDASLTQVGHLAGVESIIFEIAGTDPNASGGVWTISPSSQLPSITETLAIDGYGQGAASPNTAPTFAPGTATITVELGGPGVSSAMTGIDISAANTTITGIAIHGFTTGIHTTGSATALSGNFVGLRADGVTPGANGEGIVIGPGASGSTIGGLGLGDRLVVSSSNGAGIRIDDPSATAISVANTFVGTDASGTLPRSNTVGINVRAVSEIFIGAESAGGNLVANNLGAGVVVPTTGTVTILGNSIHDNGALGIDIGNDGVSGPGAVSPNAAIITSSTSTGGTISIDYVVDLAAGDYRVEFFTNPGGGDPSGSGEGANFVAARSIVGHPGGPAALEATIPGTTGDIVTATVTVNAGAPYGSTSEFSATSTATTPTTPPPVTTTSTTMAPTSTTTTTGATTTTVAPTTTTSTPVTNSTSTPPTTIVTTSTSPTTPPVDTTPVTTSTSAKPAPPTSIVDAGTEPDGAIEPAPDVAFGTLPDFVTGIRGSVITINVLLNDHLPPTTEGYKIELSTPAIGRVETRSDGTLVYYADDSFTGTTTFSYTVVLDNGARHSAAVTVVLGLPTLSANAEVLIGFRQPDARVTTDSAPQLSLASLIAFLSVIGDVRVPRKVLGAAVIWLTLLALALSAFRRNRRLISVSGVPFNHLLDVSDEHEQVLFRLRGDEQLIWATGRRRRGGENRMIEIETPVGTGFVPQQWTTDTIDDHLEAMSGYEQRQDTSEQD